MAIACNYAAIHCLPHGQPLLIMHWVSSQFNLHPFRLNWGYANNYSLYRTKNMSGKKVITWRGRPLFRNLLWTQISRTMHWAIRAPLPCSHSRIYLILTRSEYSTWMNSDYLVINPKITRIYFIRSQYPTQLVVCGSNAKTPCKKLVYKQLKLWWEHSRFIKWFAVQRNLNFFQQLRLATGTHLMGIGYHIIKHLWPQCLQWNGLC
jgi:hypothetical protein